MKFILIKKSCNMAHRVVKRYENSLPAGKAVFALKMLLNMVRPTGLEPVHPFGHKHLKLACLPIPAQPHRYMPSIRLRVYYTFECMICQDIF